MDCELSATRARCASAAPSKEDGEGGVKMSTHLRHCPKHRKLLPCSHCAMIAATPKPAERATGEPVKRSRGRPAKYGSEEDRKAADATRKRGERVVKKAEEIIAENPDQRGSQGELSGGFDSETIARKADGYQKAELLDAPRDPDNPEIAVPDRKRTSVPVKPDEREYSNKELKGGMTREENRSLQVWIRGPQKTKRGCVDYHARMAENHKDSKVKVYCRRCGKLLVNPGKAVRGIFSDAAPKASNAA